jgi:hypothetical protein
LNRSSERSLRLLAAALLLAIPRAAEGQGAFERLNLDKLRLTAMGGSYGSVEPSQMGATQAYSIHADYGEIAERWRVVFTVTYWGSRYDDDVVEAFADSLGRSVEDPEENARLVASGVAVSDIAVGGDIRWSPRFRFVRLRPYVGGNLSVHVLNAEGRLINGTFMEQALDNIATGIAAVGGLDIVIFSHLSLGGQARYDLLSGLQYSSLRLVGTYLFDAAPLRRPR